MCIITNALLSAYELLESLDVAFIQQCYSNALDIHVVNELFFILNDNGALM